MNILCTYESKKLLDRLNLDETNTSEKNKMGENVIEGKKLSWFPCFGWIKNTEKKK